ncbi:conserved hypothetical protein [uncultured Desulfobacterium sp.]|uniref:UbiD family decarboxylase n=1 Tax=uncultured Desulfobacterium sp. TaxID=201089 RepID=A0A445MSH7_9BACT|nr:conserved hypothetical protein [uncultured Desulfobacterium sp.]
MAQYPFTSLRDWIEFLEDKDLLVRNNNEVDLNGEVGAISRRICATDSKAVIHNNVRGYPGWKIFSDGLTTRARQAMALGMAEEGLLQNLEQKLVAAQKGMKPKLVKTGPCKEVKIDGKDFDLTKLPVPFTGEFESPPYITAGISNVMDPDTGWQNTGIRRFQLKDKNKTCNLMLPLMHEGVIFSKWIEKNKPCPIAIVIGADPLYYLCSQMPAPDQADEQDYWGVFAGQPLEVVKCETSDIVVPANAEIVIEGLIDPEKRIFEGPFSEFPGFYSGCNYLPVVDIQVVTTRKDPYYQYLYMGAPPTEGHRMGDLMFEIELYRQTRVNVPELTDVGIMSSWSFTTAASIKKSARQKRPGLAKKAGMAMKFTQAGQIVKNLFIVDDDVDVHNIDEVLWAFCVKFQPGRDITVVTDTMGVNLDPSEQWMGGALGFNQPGHSSFAIYDCTEKMPPYDEGYKRGRALPPKEMMDKVLANWDKYGF